MSASKNCPCPVCKDKAKVCTDSFGWYFRCEKCKTFIGIEEIRLTQKLMAPASIAGWSGTWRTAKEAIKAIKEYMK